jgi:hypothetical protein
MKMQRKRLDPKAKWTIVQIRKKMKQRISSGAADYIVDYAASISQKRQADVLAVDWENNTHGAVSGIAV